MKSINGVFAATLIFASFLTAQGTYPLQVGNLWQYWTYDYLNGQYTWVYGWTTRVTGDTLMPDGKIYVVIKSDGGQGMNGLILQEDSKVLSYTPTLYGTKVLYDFSKLMGDTMFVYPRPISDDSLIQVVRLVDHTTIFGTVKLRWTYFLFSTRLSVNQTDEVIDGFGLTTTKSEGGEEWFLRGALIDGTIYGTITSTPSYPIAGEPLDFILYPNYPNPFNNQTAISFSVPSSLEIEINIHDIVGRVVKTLLTGRLEAGIHTIKWDGKDDTGISVSSGMYICSIKTQHFVKRHKMLLVK